MILDRGIFSRSRQVAVAIALAALAGLSIASTGTSSAASAHAAVARPAAGTWKIPKGGSDGTEKLATWGVTKGAKIKAFAFTPTHKCADARIKVLGPFKLKKHGHGKHAFYYFGTTPTSTAPVTVSEGGVKSDAGLLIDFQTAHAATVLISAGTKFCDFQFSMKK